MNRKHGESKPQTAEYRAWREMRDRCRRRDRPAYAACGITVCAEWANSYLAFLAHVGRKPGPAYSLDRIDNSRGYEPGNVRWATAKEQARNTRSNRLLALDGETRPLAEWAERAGLSPKTVHARLAHKPLRQALSLEMGKQPRLLPAAVAARYATGAVTQAELAKEFEVQQSWISALIRRVEGRDLRKERARMRCNNLRLTLNGENLAAVQWSERLGISLQTIAKRKSRGWSDEKALTPVAQRRR